MLYLKFVEKTKQKIRIEIINNTYSLSWTSEHAVIITVVNISKSLEKEINEI